MMIYNVGVLFSLFRYRGIGFPKQLTGQKKIVVKGFVKKERH